LYGHRHWFDGSGKSVRLSRTPRQSGSHGPPQAGISLRIPSPRTHRCARTWKRSSSWKPGGSSGTYPVLKTNIPMFFHQVDTFLYLVSIADFKARWSRPAWGSSWYTTKRSIRARLKRPYVSVATRRPTRCHSHWD